ncbi:MAG: glycosyltransferase [Acidobacteria bacterium]|nr:MAG: glycosyltransferase [Acidobacteriota bacterium]
MRVLLLTGSLGAGGAEMAVQRLARGLARRGAVEPQVALIGEGGEIAQALRDEGIAVLELRQRGPLRTPAGLRRLLRLARHARTARIDLVNTFLFDADFYGMLAVRWGGVRHVITTRRAIKERHPHHLRAYRWTNRLVTRIVANSEAVRRFTIERERVPPAKVVTIPNGIEVERYAAGDRGRGRALLGLEPRDVVVGTIGSIKPVKGQRDLLEAMTPLLRARPELMLAIVGDAGSRYAADLRERIRAAGLGNRVVLPGVLRDVPDLLAAFDLFVLPSHSEGMSNALLEAMAAGRPIVATEVGGAAECLDGGAAGALVPARRPEALREAIAALLDSPARRAALGEAARRRAADEFSLDRMLARYEDLYRSVQGGAA